MSVRIQFDKPNEWHFTNLDFVTGRVILTLQSDATISAINVKLEGESRTRLDGPKFPQNDRSDKRRTELEVHKLLYKILTVFPAPSVQQQPSGSSQFTLLAGQYEYPFTFKFPFNNSCTNNNSLLRDLKLGALNVQIAPDTNKHVKRALPPTLSGFPGEAEIKYYVKVTVVRPKFYQENLRYQTDIKFFPIEPPRPPDRHEETFARRKQQFQKPYAQPTKKGLFRKASVPEPSPDGEDETPLFQVDARLPNPPIITCNEPLPLRILVQKLNNSSASVYISMLQIELLAFTHVRAHDLNRTETRSWVLTSQANMNMPLRNPVDKSTTEWKVPSRLWDSIPLPNTVAPSFETCNLTRKYELEVRVGLAHGIASALRPELIVLPLRLPVQVYSGIAPPPQLLNAMASHPRPLHIPGQPGLVNGTATGFGNQGPSAPSSATYDQSQHPARIGSVMAPSGAPGPEEPPPSYEDAMGEEIGPVDGPRRDYNVPADPEESTGSSFPSDTKSAGGGLRRAFSERLFSQNAPRRPDEASPVAESVAHNAIPGETPASVCGVAVASDVAPPQSPRLKTQGEF